MPFTLAHPAAVLPIWAGGKPRLRLAALVLGALTPDFEYFLHLNTVGRYAHSLPGLFFVCLPAGWLSLWLFDRFGRQGSLGGSSRITTPHKLQAEARSRKRVRRRRVVCPPSKPMAEACQLHAVVRPQPVRGGHGLPS